MAGETTRFTFRLEGWLRLDDPESMTGTEIPVRWGDQTATGRIERVEQCADGILVTMVIDRKLDFTESGLTHLGAW